MVELELELEPEEMPLLTETRGKAATLDSKAGTRKRDMFFVKMMMVQANIQLE